MNYHRALVGLYQVQSKSIVNTTSCHGWCYAYLGCQSACIKLKGCRIVVAFWSSSSLIVFSEFQGRIVSVHASRSEISQLGGKSGFKEMFAEGYGRSGFWHSLDFLILCGKEGAWCSVLDCFKTLYARTVQHEQRKSN